MTPKAWTQPDPLLCAIAAHARTVKTEPAMGPTALTGRSRPFSRGRRTWPGSGAAMSDPRLWISHGRGAGVDSRSSRTTFTPNATPSSVVSR